MMTKTTLLAAAAVLTLGIGSAFAANGTDVLRQTGNDGYAVTAQNAPSLYAPADRLGATPQLSAEQALHGGETVLPPAFSDDATGAP